MDNLDDSENNAKISDSAYSNSCSNSQSRRSHSSKSTHSGSSGSSGYGGKPSTSGSSNKLDQAKKDKDAKKKKLSQAEATVVEEPVVVECGPPEPIPMLEVPIEEKKNVVEATTTPLSLPEKAVENMDISELVNHKHEVQIATMQANTTVSLETSCQVANVDTAGFSCAISMHDGVVMYTTNSLTTNLGFPKDMWIGRSFIDFVHPKDCNTFAAQITNGLAVPKITNGTQVKVQPPGIIDCTMVCRIRRYRSLKNGFGVKDRTVAYMPFLLKFSFKDVDEDDGKIVYLIIQATPIYSGYRVPHESKCDVPAFVIRHSASGILEYIDIESVPYLGYLPQDVQNTDILLLYHPEDLPYLKMIYETIVKEGTVSKSMPYRMLTQNGDYVKLETEWSSFINPWSMKLEFVIGKHYIVEGPATTDVFLTPPPTKPGKVSEEEKMKIEVAETHRQNILKILKDVLTKPAEKAKQQMSKRCHDLALIMEKLLYEQPKVEEELRVEIQEQDLTCCERDSVMLGGISPHHEYNESKSSTETPLSYNQLNYNQNLQRYFDSHQNYCFDENTPVLAVCEPISKPSISKCLMSPMAQHSTESNDMSSSGSSTALMWNSLSPSATMADLQTSLRLTESLLTKHNNDMEKQLAKCHRETRTSTKGQRAANTRQKKEHLARCNADYQPTMAGAAFESAYNQSHGVKRSLMPVENETSHKQHCTPESQARRRQNASVADTSFSSTTPTTVATNLWQDASKAVQTNALNPTALSTQQMPLLPGVFPVYYAQSSDPALMAGVAPTMGQMPTAGASMPPPHTHQMAPTLPQMPHYTNAPISWMYPQPVYGSPYMYNQMSYNIQQQQAMLAQPMAYQTLNPLVLPTSNYMQACKSSLPLRPSQPVVPASWADSNPSGIQTTTSPAAEQATGDFALIAPDRTTEKKPEVSSGEKTENAMNSVPSGLSGQNSEEPVERTDGESSYSSFYSSFFRTESGTAEDSSDSKKAKTDSKKCAPVTSCYTYEPQTAKKAPRRKMDPPWMEHVCVTSDLVYKYQIQPKSKEEVLQADLEKIKNFEQPALVNEQLGQLYLDLQLEGVASRLTLEEGITSSSNSSDEACFSAPSAKAPRQKRAPREYSKLNMIYEEDAPLPPPPISKN